MTSLTSVSRSLAQHSARLPRDGSIIAASASSVVDPLYLSAIFDPLFVAAYPNTRLVEPVNLLQAVLRAFSTPRLTPKKGTRLVDLDKFVKENSNRITVVFPECTTSNNRGILPLSPCLLSAPAKTKVYAVSLRYSPNDITTPVPHSYGTFLWNLCAKPTHGIRIRIAEAVYNTSRREGVSTRGTSRSSSADIPSSDGGSDADTLVGGDEGEGPQTKEERAFLDHIAESLARLGRVKRVGLGVKEKIDFTAAWSKYRRS